MNLVATPHPHVRGHSASSHSASSHSAFSHSFKSKISYWTEFGNGYAYCESAACPQYPCGIFSMHSLNCIASPIFHQMIRRFWRRIGISISLLLSLTVSSKASAVDGSSSSHGISAVHQQDTSVPLRRFD